MDIVYVKGRKYNKNVSEGFRILAIIIAREYLKNQVKTDDGETISSDQNVAHIQAK